MSNSEVDVQILNKDQVNTRQSLGLLISYCRKDFKIIIVAICFFIVSALISVISPRFIEKFVSIILNGITLQEVNIDMRQITYVAYILIAIYIIGMLLELVQSFIMNQISCNVAKQIRTDINSKLNRVPLKYFDSHNNGDTLSLMTNDVNMLSQSLSSSLGTLISSLTIILGCVIMMFSIEWRMALTAIIASYMGLIGMAIIMSKAVKYFNLRQESLAKVNSHVEEYYTGHNIIRVYNAEESTLIKFRECNDKLCQHSLKAEILSCLIQPLMVFTNNLGYIAICIVGAYMAFNQIIEFSVVVAFMIYVQLFSSAMSQIGQGLSSMQFAVAASTRIEGLMQEKEMLNESDKLNALSEVSGSVSFENISFGYEKENIIIDSFSASVKAGQKVAIVGPTGAGKTTIVNLLMRFYEINSGTISIDNTPINKVTRENLRNIFGMVLQEPWLFEGSVRDNITYGKNVSDQRLKDICEQCGLKHFISMLPNGYDTILDEKITISAGQKQLITIARAMIKDAPMLILDEATSSIDTGTEIMIQKATDALAEGRTIFVIAHRLSTIRNSDLIIYMQNGSIKETGTHEELLAMNGLYAELYNSQFVM